MFNKLTLRSKITFLPILASIVFLILVLLTYDSLQDLSKYFKAVSQTNTFAKQNLTLAKDVQKLNSLVQKYSFTGKEKSSKEALELYHNIQKFISENQSSAQLDVSESFQKIQVHLNRYYETFITLKSQTITKQRVYQDKIQTIDNIHSLSNSYFSYKGQDYYELIHHFYKSENSLQLFFKTLKNSHKKDAIKEVKLAQKKIQKLAEDEKNLDKIATLNEISTKLKNYRSQLIKEIQHYRANHFLVNVVMAAEAFEVLYQATLISDRSKELLIDIDSSVSKNINSTINNIAITALIALLLLLAVSLYITKSIVKPIGNLTNTFNALVKGDVNTEIPTYKVKDDLGALTKAAQSFKEKNEVAEYLLQQSNDLSKSLQDAKHQAESANKAKSNFLANMSHEIRTPLNAIMGFIDLLKKEETNPDKLKFLNIVQTSSTSLLGVINDILDISKIEDDKLDIEHIDFNLREHLENLLHFYSATTKTKKISLQLNIDPSVPKAINSDPLRLKQVISNLISNAIKFSPENGSIHVNISHNEDQLYVSVQDEGVGISEEAQKRIFNAFEQAESSTTRTSGGTGLGLSIAKKLVELLGGAISIESTINEGSTFSFYIQAKEGESYVDDEPQDEHIERLTGHLLVAEDNKTNQMLIKILLEEMGLTYQIANNGQEALEAVQKEHYDLILMDINMPIMGGIEATQKILQLDNDVPPIIALTANAMKDDIKTYHETGMKGFVSKPVDNFMLYQELSKYLDQAA